MVLVAGTGREEPGPLQGLWLIFTLMCRQPQQTEQTRAGYSVQAENWVQQT